MTCVTKIDRHFDNITPIKMSGSSSRDNNGAGVDGKRFMDKFKKPFSGGGDGGGGGCDGGGGGVSGAGACNPVAGVDPSPQSPPATRVAVPFNLA